MYLNSDKKLYYESCIEYEEENSGCPLKTLCEVFSLPHKNSATKRRIQVSLKGVILQHQYFVLKHLTLG